MNTGRTTLLIGAGILFLVGMVVGVLVIPQVATDPLATPESAIPSFWANVVATLFFAVLLVAGALVSNLRLRGALIGLASFGAFVLGLFLLDAAQAFDRHGPGMQGVTVALFICVGGDFIAGAFAFMGTGLTARFRRRETGA